MRASGGGGGELCLFSLTVAGLCLRKAFSHTSYQSVRGARLLGEEEGKLAVGCGGAWLLRAAAASEGRGGKNKTVLEEREERYLPEFCLVFVSVGERERERRQRNHYLPTFDGWELIVCADKIVRQQQQQRQKSHFLIDFALETFGGL